MYVARLNEFCNHIIFLQRNEQKYLRELGLDGRASVEAKFGYALCLVRCAHKQDIAKVLLCIKLDMQFLQYNFYHGTDYESSFESNL